ncbi:hypothetical protein [Spiroplasma endosymbiont of Polydrusus pterygomalis]|uniref:hypothetical protein n=1 Tax=Spiroplasma endosymbiont of Polydrusus pterygomalis TaxID=3139327 RepID=UPI003CCAE1F1
MSKREKKKKIISGVMSSATLIGGVTAGIIYASKTEEEKKEKEKTKTQSSIKPKQSKSNTYIKQQFTIYLDKNRKKVKISKIDLSDENIKEIV